MSSRIKLYNRGGLQVAEISAKVKRTWKISEYSEATFTLSLNDAKAIRENLEFGGFLVVEHDKLDIWAGMIDPVRGWGYKIVTVTAYSGEYILSTRRGPSSIKIEGYGGLALKQIVDLANSAGHTLLQIGDYSQNNAWMAKTLDTTDLYSAVGEFVKASGQEWNVTPAFDAFGVLQFRANWYVRMGTVRQEKLIEGKNFELTTTPMVEQGKIVNDLVGFGTGATWDSKTSIHRTDQTSIDRYGLRQGSESFGDDIHGTIEANTIASLARSKNPRKTFDIKALDVGNLFYNLRLGDTLPIKFDTVGFNADGSIGIETNVRILGMTFDDADNKCELVLDEVV